MLRRIIFGISVLLAIIILSALSVRSKPLKVKRGNSQIEELENIKNYMNFRIDPCDDFYEYACGNWKVIHPIPKNAIEHNAFSQLSWKVEHLLKQILENPEDDATYSEAEIKAKTLYKSCMKIPDLREESKKQYSAILDSLGGWPVLNPNWHQENFDWLNLTAQIKLLGVTGLISEMVGPSQADFTRSSLYISEYEFSVVKREDFLNPSDISLLPGYKLMMRMTMEEFGATIHDADIATREILDFEKELAKITIGSNDDKFDVVTLEVLKQKIPEIDWDRFLTLILGTAIPEDLHISLFDETYFKQLPGVLSRTTNQTIANFLLWRLMMTRTEIVDMDESKLCLGEVMEEMGSAVSAMFVRKYFDDDIRKDVFQVIDYMQNSFKENLKKNTWLDSKTKKEAETKLNATSSLIGYPKYFLENDRLNNEYKNFTINSTNYFHNVFESKRYKTKQHHSKLWDNNIEDDWEVQPAVVNGYYNLRKNTIVIPAAILQPPVYSKNFPKAMIYGAFGSFIGHELTHGFDKDGRQYDAAGNRQNWWTNNSAQQFSEEVGCLITQYNNYTVPELGVTLNGEETLSENIADNGGLRHAFHAYENWLKTADSKQLEKETIPGLNLTNTQLFFVGFAQFYCEQQTLVGLVALLNTDNHSLQNYRVKGSVSNFEKFAQEFKCAPGTNMNPDVKCKIW